MKWIGLSPIMIALIALSASSQASVDPQDEQLFLQAAKAPSMDPATQARVNGLLEKITIDNSFGSAPPAQKLHVLEYNVEQGLGFDDLQLLLSNGEEFLKEKLPDADEHAREQILSAGSADLMIMSELDVGVCRTEYRDVPHELSQATKMNYVYATEFLELEPKDLGAQKHDLHACKNVDYSRTQNLTGDAIFSRFPIRNARRLPLEDCYDWYRNELHAPWYKKLFHWPRQLRRGQRAAIIADVDVGGEIGTLTVVSAHLEVNARASCRRDQMEQILDAVSDVKNPVIIAGDLNTIHLRGSEKGLFKEWQDAGFDLSGNDGRGTDLNPWLRWLGIRLDHIGVRGLRIDDGETLTELGKHHIKVSDHAPISVDVEENSQ